MKPPTREDPLVREAEEHRLELIRRGRTKGLLIINTGHGKGKTTAALGMAVRAAGHGMQVSVIQFIKNSGHIYGDAEAGRKLGIDWTITGDGWTWTSTDLEQSAALAKDGWRLAQEKIASAKYNLLILDEFTYPLLYEWIEVSEVLSWLEENRPPDLHLVVTGRDAPKPLLEAADLVTEMKEIKHPYKTQGIPAQEGVDY